MVETPKKFDRDFRKGAVRLVRETGKPIAQVARDLGIYEGTLGNWVSADKRRRGEGDGALSEDERSELARLRRENAELAMERVLKRSVAPLGEGRDGAVAVAAFIAAQRDKHRIPQALSCRALGVSQSWFYKWKDGTPPPRAARTPTTALPGRVRKCLGGPGSALDNACRPRVLALHPGIRAAVGGALRHQGRSAGQGRGVDRGLQPPPRHSACQMMSPAAYQNMPAAKEAPEMSSLLLAP
jgi:transposase